MTLNPEASINKGKETKDMHCQARYFSESFSKNTCMQQTLIDFTLVDN